MDKKSQFIITKGQIDKNWNKFLLGNYIYGFVKPVVDYLKGRPRSFHCFVIGTAKSGTHSLHGLFSRNFKSMHEPSFQYINKMIIDSNNNQLTLDEVKKFYKVRDSAMRLDVESNYLNYYFINVLVDIFPDAKFIILYRPLRSWLDSWLNHKIERKETPGSIEDEALKSIYSPERYEYDRHESEILKKYGLHPLRCYIDHWLLCNQMLIENIPDRRLMVLETKQISNSSQAIADFLGIKAMDLEDSRSHLFKAKGKHHILDKLDPEYVENLIAEYETHPAISKIKNKITQLQN